MMRRSMLVGAAVLLGLTLAAAGAQAGRTLSMNGQWFMNRGPLVDIPANGGARLCGGPPSTGCVNNLRPANGGIPAATQLINATGTGPAGFTITNNQAFFQAGGAANRQTVPVAGIPTVIQLASQFSLAGPGLGTPNASAGPATFQANASVLDPRQAARLGPNFTWCPPNGACVTPTYSQTYGAYRAVMRYTAGANRFGGTMQMMLRDTGVVSINIGGPVLHQLVGGTSNPTFGPQMAGGGYGNFRQITLAPGPVHSFYTIPSPCTSPFGQEPTPPGCGLIGAQGGQVATLPGSINRDWGMPLTTGTVRVRNLASGTADPATTFTVMGTDSRTALGRGQITLVSGATTERSPSGNHFAALEVVTMTFGSPSTPLLSTPAIMAMIALMLLAGGYMARRHFATEVSS